MPRKCDLCGKAAQYGNNVSHSKRHTKRRWLPNIQSVVITISGERKRLNLCTRCMRTQYKSAR